MAKVTYSNQLTALLVIDPYNDFISEGGKIWDRIRAVAEANDCVPHKLQVLNAARKAKLRVFYALHRRYRPGDYETWKYIAPIQKAAWERKSFEYGTWGGEIRPGFEPEPGEIVAAEHWCSSGFANTDLDLQLKKHGIHQLIVIGLIAHTCVEATVRYAAELGYEVTVVKDATADYSDEAMHAALDMSNTQAPSESAIESPRARGVDMKLEVVVIPVSDVDRAKRFYSSLGWRLDADFAAGDDFRVIQFTPPGSGCSVILGKNVTAAAPGSAQGLYLIVSDVEAAQNELLGRGVEISEVFHDAGGVHAGADEPYLFGRLRVGGRDPEHRSYRSFASFSDPDGNGWLIQEVTARLPGRLDADTTFTSNELAAALRRAATAHGEHEKRTGRQDANWPDWYAEYIVREQAGKPLPS